MSEGRSGLREEDLATIAALGWCTLQPNCGSGPEIGPAELREIQAVSLCERYNQPLYGRGLEIAHNRPMGVRRPDMTRLERARHGSYRGEVP